VEYLLSVPPALDAMSDSTDASVVHGATPSPPPDDGEFTTSTAAALPASRAGGRRKQPMGVCSGLGGSTKVLKEKDFNRNRSVVGDSSAGARASKPRKANAKCPIMTEIMLVTLLLCSVALATARKCHVMALKALGVSNLSRLFTFAPAGMTLAVPIHLLCRLLRMTSTWSDEQVDLVADLEYDLANSFSLWPLQAGHALLSVYRRSFTQFSTNSSSRGPLM